MSNTAVTSAINWLKDKKKQIGDGAAKIVDNVNSAKDLAGEVKKEILVTAKKIKANVSIQSLTKMMLFQCFM